MLANGIKETTATTGTGTVTLAAVTGFTRFASGFATSALASYAIKDGNNWEWGVGTVGAANTLDRTTITATLVAGTYTSSGAIAITLASGAAEVICTEHTGTKLTLSNKTSAYTVVAGDNGTIINCTANSFTVSLTAAATLGAGFNCWIWNTSVTVTHVVTIDPSGAETIDGLATLLLRRGEGLQIVCDGTNWQTGDKKAMRGFAQNIVAGETAAIASGDGSIAWGVNVTASGANSIAVGYSATAASNFSTAVGNNSGGNGSKTITGSGAMALGGSYASGADSFAAAVANNTSTYGATGANSVVTGQTSKATAANTEAHGLLAIASGAGSTVSGGSTNTASGNYSSIRGGLQASSAIYGKDAFASGQFATQGDAQTGMLVLRIATTSATATVITSNAAAAATTNQVILPNNSAYAFRVQVVGMQQAAGGSGAAGYTFTGLIRRGVNAAATVLLASAKTVDHETNAAWDCSVTADATNGGLAVTVTGVAATNICWVATVHTTEVTYA